LAPFWAVFAEPLPANYPGNEMAPVYTGELSGDSTTAVGTGKERDGLGGISSGDVELLALYRPLEHRHCRALLQDSL
jgi:hypothetical protein